MMKHLFFNFVSTLECDRRECDRRIMSIPLFMFALILLYPVPMIQAQTCNQNVGYLFQKIERYAHDFYIPFKHNYVLPHGYGFYIVDDSAIQCFFDHDSVSYDNAILLCDPADIMFSDSPLTDQVTYSTRIKDILMMDDSEIYEIGGDKYIIRKIRYAFFDNAQVKVFIRGRNYYWWDDISDADTAEYNAAYEVGELYRKDYYECYHHLIEILPTPKNIQGHVWRRLYECADENRFVPQLLDSNQKKEED